MIEYANVSSLIGSVISSKMATLSELDTVYSVEDAYLLLEVYAVDSHNQRVLNAAQQGGN